MANRKNLPLFFSFFISALIFIFYLKFINLSSDTIMLFLTSKIFLGKWLAKGIFPLFNPHIFAGVPFGFDIGLGNFYPLNILFILPYPLSFALWSGIISFIFIYGFYLFFNLLTKTKRFSFLLTLILFFSGSGVFLRMNNPTILAVIAHYGFFLYSLRNLQDKGLKSYLTPLIWGILMTLSGHIQFVLYGYLLGLIVGVFINKIKLKKLIYYYFLLFISTSWYYIFSLPLILSSTRMFLAYDKSGSIQPLQLLQLVLPFIFGEKFSGARWNIGYDTIINISLIFTSSLFLLFYKKNVNKVFGVILSLLLITSFGLIPIPFLRNTGQIFVMVHIIGLIIIANNEKFLIKTLAQKNNYLPIILFLNLLLILFFFNPFFSEIFMTGYKIIKHGQTSLFFDRQTIQAIGGLIGRSLMLMAGLILILLFIKKTKKLTWPLLFIFIIFEGLFVNFYFNYFIPANILLTKVNLPEAIDTKNYRVQSTSDTLPYFGFNIYVENVLFRPPFSKEKPLFDKKEQKDFTYLKKLLSLNASSFSMINDTKSIQGYATFVPQKIAVHFNKPSEDYEKQYAEIIKRNPLFNQQKITHINAIDTTRTTLFDKRWTDLSVGYFLSDHQLQDYELIYQNDNRYIYKNPEAISINQLINTGIKESITPVKETPNEAVFNIGKKDIGEKLLININPDGFRVTINSKPVNTIKRDFELEIDLKTLGKLKISYSPILHLKEVLQSRKILL